MMKHMEQTTTVSLLKVKLILVLTLCTAICLIMMISMFLMSFQSTISISSAENLEQLSLFNDTPKASLNQSSVMMNAFMRSFYHETTTQQRKKRHLNSFYSSLSLSDDIDSIISLSNRYNHSTYSFEYNFPLEHLVHIELVFPIQQLTNLSTIHIQSNQFDLLFKQPFHLERNWLQLNLTQYIRSFPVTFSIRFSQITLRSSAFLTLYFRRVLSSHIIHRRDLSSFNDGDDQQLVTHPSDPLSCQVRPLRTSFAELNWTSWIIEPSSYEMNTCSGICHTSSQTPSYFIMQNLLHRIYPRKIPTLCCKPKRFSSTILLYYDGPNIVLKRHDNMRVVECSCS